jgi:hypothetical protein
MYLYDIVIDSFQHVDKQILLKMVIYSPKHVNNDTLKHRHLSITLDGVLNILYTITSVTDQDEQN